MRNIKLTIEYDGTNYCGWQSQSHNKCKKSIQETLERALRKILQEKIHLIASGRTDAGVHALAQVANFKTNSNISTAKLQKALNGILPDDIRVCKIEEASPDFHSRFAAKSKLYRYTILNRNYGSAILRDRVYFYPYPLDVRLMYQQARCLVGRHDFKAFCAAGSGAKSTIRQIKNISISKKRYTLITIDIEADGFLYNMVRNIVGTLIEIGKDRFPKGSLKKILLSKNRKLAGPTAPAKGLCLIKVKYG
jgi:tRNA pseudouridine38-40 synthase